jgi:FKBP-type peptidyl-prolyl cis-trans isomerase
MIKKYTPFALLALSLITTSACNAQKGGFKKTAKGLEYKIVKDAPGTQKPVVGDYMEFHIHAHLGDSVLFDSRKMNNNQPVPFPLTAPNFNGDLTEGFTMLTVGDSAVFRVPVDSVLKAGGQLPFAKAGQKQFIQYEVAVTKVQSKAQMEAEMKTKAAAQNGIDDNLIQEYIAKKGIKATKTASGLYYVIDKPGTGPNAAPGQYVTMNYTGTTLDGKPFDSNVDPQFQHVQPFPFVLGQGQVIRGWDEGVALMNKGAKGKLLIPSSLAYGPQDRSPSFGPNSVLIFDVEVTDIAATPPQQPQMQMQQGEGR